MAEYQLWSKLRVMVTRKTIGVTTLAGLEPTRDKPNRFLVDRLNRSATVSRVDRF